MGKGIDRTQILRIDCNKCKGKGFTMGQAGEEPCNTCEGSGMLEKEVPFKFENLGKWDKQEVADAFGIPVEEVKDEGHSTGE